MDFPKSINAGDVELAKVDATFDNARYVFNIIDSNREYMGRWLNWVGASKRPEDMYSFMRRVAETTNGSYYIVKDDAIIGGIGVEYSEKNKVAEVGYWLSPEFTGCGIMTRALRALEKFCFETIAANRIEILVDVDNIKSQAVALRAGFIKEGVLRQSMMLHGVPRDTIMYSKIKSDWEKENKNA